MHIIVIAATLVLGLGIVTIWRAATAFVAPHAEEVGAAPADLPVECITLTSRSGSCLAGWYIPAIDARGVIVLVHPYQGSRLAMINRAHLLHSAGYSVVMIDLQAHGESPGKHITIGYLERHDVEAAVDFARTRHPDEPIGIIGFSMGGAATLLASPLNVDAIVLEAVYPHIFAAVYNRVRVKLGALAALPTYGLLMQFKPRLGISVSDLRPIDGLRRIDCPVFIMSGTADPHTTEADTQSMFQAASDVRDFWMVEGAGHEDLYDFAPSEYESRVLRFFERYLCSVSKVRQAESV